VPSPQRHLTLRFFEELPEGRVEDVCGAAGAAAAETPRFDLEMEGLGCFPERGPAKVVWAGFGGGREALVHLAAALSRELAGRGFPGETRPFSPHLTLARSRNPRGSSAVAAAVRGSAFSAWPLGRVRVEALLLIRSTLGSGPPRHDVLGKFPLAV
jgi:RNA 2',3'-cyclic 3'-phosphodiesterase